MRKEICSLVAASVAAGFSPRFPKEGGNNPLAPFAKGEDKGRSFARKILFLVLGVLVIGTSILLAEVYLQKESDLKNLENLPPITRETIKNSCSGPIKTAQAAATPGWYGGCNSGYSFPIDTVSGITICSYLGLTAKYVVCGFWNQNAETGVPESFSDTRSYTISNTHYKPDGLQANEILNCSGTWASRSISLTTGYREWGQKTGQICTKPFRACGNLAGGWCYEIASCYVWCE